jgi:very-short-patch-repair endonuclease
MFLGAAATVFSNAEKNRHSPTLAELRLWELFLAHKPGGYKFRRQHPLGLFIAYFYCHSLRLVIEVDGSVHYCEEARMADKQRQDWIEAQGISVIRFRNEEVLQRLDRVKAEVEQFFQEKGT